MMTQVSSGRKATRMQRTGTEMLAGPELASHFSDLAHREAAVRPSSVTATRCSWWRTSVTPSGHITALSCARCWVAGRALAPSQPMRKGARGHSQ